jgi:DNA-binding response OmpR family regulator
LRILLIEDSPSDSTLIRANLEAELSGVEILRAKTLAGGLRKLSGARLDCILLDLGLPDAHGMEVIREVVSRAQDAAVVVLTGRKDDELATMAIQMGVQDFVMKSEFAFQELPRTIKYAIHRHRYVWRTQKEERRAALALTAAGQALWDWDALSDTLYLSPQWFVMLGLTRSPFMGNLDTWITRVHFEDQETLSAAVREGEGNSDGIRRASFRIAGNDGIFHPAEARWVPVERGGRLVQCVGVQYLSDRGQPRG